ncbi:MAG: 16S rRNA (guanine(527)-N(7))-methyltransferase RsmG [Porticoccus sp.]|nr:16S rRNA (guanine(527)-N(7))-methyltransferase RsmG [Porticoccus sp.]
MSKELETFLREGVEQLALSVTDQQVVLLLEYLALLKKWNGAYNLTAIRDPEQMLRLHVLDSLSIIPFIQGDNILDVGTGPGLPGIPLAIFYPERKVTLMDSNGKKTRFLFQARNQLGLGNVVEIQSRAETYEPQQQFDAITSRAFTSLADMVEKTAHLITTDGRFYAMKGQHPDQELRVLSKHYNVVASHQLQVPGVDSERHLIEIALSKEHL